MAIKKLKVKPNPDKTINGRKIQVVHPFHTDRKINTKGEEIQACDFLTRRLKDGDLVLCDGKKETSHQPKSQTSAQSKNETK